MNELDDLQRRLYQWALLNKLIPLDGPIADTRAIYGQFMGVVEEIGELAHVLLKRSQGIRLEEATVEKERDAVGDIAIFLLNYCSVRHWQLSEVLKETAEEVLQREWRT